jgi:putative peptidoglycan lipid II flippase
VTPTPERTIPAANAAPAPAGPAVREAVGRPAALMSVATLSSRIAGVARESLFAALIGARANADAFNVGFRIPNLLRDLFAEGALSGAFVPTLGRVRAERGEAAAFAFARRVLGTLVVVTSAVALLGIVFAPALVDLLASGGERDVRDLATRLTRIMFPFLPTVAAAAVLMGVLNANRRFFLPALAPAAFNGVAIAGGLVLLALGFSGEEAVTGWAVLVVVGGLVQALVQVPVLRAVGWRGAPTTDLRFRDPDLRLVVRRMAPVALALAGTQLMVVTTTAIASREQGWISALQYAFRVVHLPIGLVGVALGSAALAAASRRAAEGDAAGLDDVVRRGLRWNAFLGLPAAAGLFALAEPAVRLLYERGRFSPEDTARVVEALRAYAVGIVFYAGSKVAVTAFHARGDTRTPMLCSLAGIAANLGFCFGFVGTLGLAALALGTALGSALNYGLLRALSRRRHGTSSGPGGAFVAKTAVATAVLLGASWAASEALLVRGRALGGGWLLPVGLVAVTGACGMLYLVVAKVLTIPEVSFLGRRATGRAPR